MVNIVNSPLIKTKKKKKKTKNKRFPAEDVWAQADAIENIHPEFVAYKSAEFWREASLEYIKRDILKGAQRRTSTTAKIAAMKRQSSVTTTTTTTSTMKRQTSVAASSSAMPTVKEGKESRGAGGSKSWSLSLSIDDSIKVIAVVSLGAAAIYAITRLRTSSVA